MEPKTFKEVNIVFAKDQSEYNPLPAFKQADSFTGHVVTCWGLTFRERLRILFRGEVWLCMITFNKPLTPVFLTTEKDEVLTTNQ